MSSPVLPLQIQQHIVSLADTRMGAMDCALVCRDWLTTSRSITFSSPIECVSLTDVRTGESSLISLLQHPHSTLCTFMTRIHLVIALYRRNKSNTSGTLVDYDGIFRTIITHVKIITELHVEQGTFPQSDSPDWYIIPNLIDFMRAYLSSIQVVVLEGYLRPPVLALVLETLSDAAMLTDLTICPVLLSTDVFPRSLPAAPSSLKWLKTSCTDQMLVEKWGHAASQVVFAIRDQTDTHEFRSALLCLEKETENTGVPRTCSLELRSNLPLEETDDNPLEICLRDSHLASLVTAIHLGVYRENNEFLPLLDLSHCASLGLLNVLISFSDGDFFLPPIISVLDILSTQAATSRPGFQLNFTISYDVPYPNEVPFYELDQAMDAYLKGMFEARHLNIRVENCHRQGTNPRPGFIRCVARELVMPNLAFITWPES